MSGKKSKEFPEAGDKVRVVCPKKDYEGILLESPVDEKGIILLKLESGYNIGFNKKDILRIELIEKSKLIEDKTGLKKDPSKPNIAMIITGGTIASRLDPKTGGVHPLTNPDDFFKFYPEIFEIANIIKIEIPFMKASEDMDFKDWQKIANLAQGLLNDSNIQGLIITHGTDFLHYTSAVLSFMLNSFGKLNKPVVLTYSQRSIDRASSDANLNLKCSALVAGLGDIAEVMLVGHASTNDDFCYAMPGTKVRKMHSSKRDAFKVVNSKPFAKIYFNKKQEGIIEKISDYRFREKGKIKADTNFEEKVALVKIYPGQNPEILDYYFEKGYKGLVLEMCGLGHVPTSYARKGWTKKLKEIQKKGVIVCAAAQTIFGRLDPLVYSNGREILETGVIYLEDMLAETAFVKLSWVLGHKNWVKQGKEKIREKMLENISWEISDRLEE
ncbi:Glu-tRNA(Gln) amidotransferase subunit GatD [Candidatus Pacearchaeota archaeon]|nr:Glu-tRNA(Gln) amidotransferase subunit GatD [Candidatus Pacearchaeota archaeon]